jgi:hypothetical protein
MFHTRQLVTACFAIIAWGSAAVAALPKSRHDSDASVVLDLHPFTHTAYIPAGSDLSSIAIESIKAVKVATKVRVRTDLGYCEDAPVWEPGGSIYCPRTSDESLVRAYEVTFSFRGQPMASDEYGGTNFTFSVYYRPDEISPALRRTISSGKISRSDIAEFFQFTTSRNSVRQIVMDQANSTVCEGNYVDGSWSHTSPKCGDSVAYQTVAGASPYIAVRVEPVLPEPRV